MKRIYVALFASLLTASAAIAQIHHPDWKFPRDGMSARQDKDLLVYDFGKGFSAAWKQIQISTGSYDGAIVGFPADLDSEVGNLARQGGKQTHDKALAYVIANSVIFLKESSESSYIYITNQNGYEEHLFRARNGDTVHVVILESRSNAKVWIEPAGANPPKSASVENREKMQNAPVNVAQPTVRLHPDFFFAVNAKPDDYSEELGIPLYTKVGPFNTEMKVGIKSEVNRTAVLVIVPPTLDDIVDRAIASSGKSLDHDEFLVLSVALGILRLAEPSRFSLPPSMLAGQVQHNFRTRTGVGHAIIAPDRSGILFWVESSAKPSRKRRR